MRSGSGRQVLIFIQIPDNTGPCPIATLFIERISKIERSSKLVRASPLMADSHY
jgi:hypothetical protein